MSSQTTDTETDAVVSIPFATKFLEPIIRGDKTATLRYEEYDVSAGDDVLLVSADENTEWAWGEVETTFTCEAQVAADLLAQLEAKHTVTKTETAPSRVLQSYYREQITPESNIQGIVWNVTQPFATAPANQESAQEGSNHAQ